ncbi:hypothetical protein HJC23_000562 [Cyclotella cryptica]|uniref:1-alkyl-2-acetylglycerophosphocholine esterase n=1 Tax=Cyclotella cryptica TaxID=29204 RepID=A0ABD3PT42_9STRA|eukprot:CCRYP_011774-RA/>CCRYP_011774-RA protein AED:0.11 eAED:0.11 QI:0/-1/0/1/-1/1/1/0/416
MLSLSPTTCAITSQSLFVLLLLASIVWTSSSLSLPTSFHRPHPRSAFVRDFSQVVSIGLGNVGKPAIARETLTSSTERPIASGVMNQVIYEPTFIDVLGEQIPVAAWYTSKLYGMSSNDSRFTGSSNAVYKHRISVKKIGRSLAGWNFIPSFTTRSFTISPSETNVVQVESSVSTPNFASSTAPVVLLAHGYLGSRFDLSHYAEDLAAEGFLVLSPEYPESLADSYDTTTKPIDRTLITNQLLQTLNNQWYVKVTSYGIIGHSLGCGTAIKTGDDSWARVCIAGFPSSGSKGLFIASTNDGAVPISRVIDSLKSLDYVSLDENAARIRQWDKLPLKTSLVFNEIYDNRPPPNHISFLSEGTNAAMVDFLSPLLPVARYFGIPVLDFDKYQLVRDSGVTGEVVRPLVVEYLKQMSAV